MFGAAEKKFLQRQLSPPVPARLLPFGK